MDLPKVFRNYFIVGFDLILVFACLEVINRLRNERDNATAG
jgi:hypothetical protein